VERNRSCSSLPSFLRRLKDAFFFAQRIQALFSSRLQSRSSLPSSRLHSANSSSHHIMLLPCSYGSIVFSSSLISRNSPSDRFRYQPYPSPLRDSTRSASAGKWSAASTPPWARIVSGRRHALSAGDRIAPPLADLTPSWVAEPHLLALNPSSGTGPPSAAPSRSAGAYIPSDLRRNPSLPARTQTNFPRLRLPSLFFLT